MKKLMIALMASLVAGFVCADSTVTSANIVGYKTLSIVGSNLNMLACNWQKVQGGDINIQDLLGNKDGLTAGSGLGVSDNLLIWDPASSGYKQYWLYASGQTYASWAGKWIDLATTVPASNDTVIPIGSGAWYQSIGASDWTLTVNKPY